MTLRWKPKHRQTRIVYSDTSAGAMPEHKGKVFAVIGPFDDDLDKLDLQNMLLTLLRGYNMQSGPRGRAIKRALPGMSRYEV